MWTFPNAQQRYLFLGECCGIGGNGEIAEIFALSTPARPLQVHFPKDPSLPLNGNSQNTITSVGVLVIM